MNGQLLGRGGPMPGMAPQVAVAQPLNDVQLVALIAGDLYGAASGERTPAQAVEAAIEIVAEACVQGSYGLSRRIVEKQKAAAAA